MSSKEKAVEQLKAAGYQARLEKGVVMVFYKNVDEYEALKDEVKAFLKEEADYHQSFGIKAAERILEVADAG